MVCPTCHKTVPDESVFCLRCGTRFPRAERRVSGNGGVAAVATARSAPGVAAPSGERQAYALSFKPLANDRLRYRLARWVCEVAPAHQFAEVQDGLLRGDFATFLALTAEEARAVGQRVQALGVHAALMHLAPATEAEIPLPAPPKKGEPASGWTLKQRVLAAAIIILTLLVFGLFFWFMFG